MRTPTLRRPFAVPTIWCLSLALLGSCTVTPIEQSQPADEVSAGIAMFATLGTRLDGVESKLTDLLAAYPEDALAWRPMEGTRSVREVFLHVAADNFYMPIRILGTDAPESTGITSDWDTAVEFEGRAMTGAEVAEAMAASFAHLRSAMEATAGDLDQELTLGSNTRTVGQIWVGIVAHLHEHLGQSIAYARTNQIVPPWSM